MKKHKTTIGIIGFGNFGTLLACILASDFDLKIYNYKNSEENTEKAKKLSLSLDSFEEVAKQDIVILSVPISETKETIKKVAPLMKDGALLMDTCSVKVYPCDWLKQYTNKNIEIIGTHPMFGPTTSKFDIDKKSYKLSGLQMVLCPLRISDDRLASLEKYLNSKKLQVVTTSPEEHDKQNAKTLSFVHFVGRSLLASGIGHQEIYTPGYTDLLSILPHTTSDNWQLFFDMNNYNPYAAELREKFRDAGLDLEEKIIDSQEKTKMKINREKIDLLDQRILKLLEMRYKAVREIGEIKKKEGKQIVDKERERAILEEKKKLTKLDGEFVEDLYKVLFKEAYRLQ